MQNQAVREPEGAQPAFIEIWTAHHRAVFWACAQWLGWNLDDADDAYSRTGVKAFENWPPACDTPLRPRPWLLAVARNVCMDIHRERRRSRETSLEETADHLATLADVGPDPETALIEREHARMLDRAIDALPPILFAVADPLIRAGRSYAEIARELGIHEVTARKRMEQARKWLQRLVTARAVSHAKRRREREPRPPLVHVVQFEVGGVRHETVLSIEIERPRRPESRIARIEREVAKYTRGWRRRLELARVLAVCGRLEESIPYYRFVIDKSPFPLQPWLELGAIYTALGRHAEAEALYVRGAREAGREPDRVQLRALAAAAKKNHNLPGPSVLNGTSPGIPEINKEDGHE